MCALQVFEGECASQIAKAPGCECSAPCTAQVDAVTEQACKNQIIETICESAEEIEMEAKIDIRSLFLHLLNDCSTLTEATCPAGVRLRCPGDHRWPLLNRVLSPLQ